MHNTAHIQDLEGRPILTTSIQKEWSLGLGRLQTSKFSRYFTMPIEQIMSKILDWKQTWFQIIRQARILMNPFHLHQDEFTSSKNTTEMGWNSIYSG